MKDILAGLVVLVSLGWLGKKMDKKFYRLVGKKHRYDYK